MKHKNKRLTYGFVLDFIESWEDVDYYQSLVLSGITDFVREHDINLMCFVTGKLNSPHEWDKGRNILFDFIDKYKVDGLIVLSSAVEGYCTPADVGRKLNDYKGIPIVTINYTCEGYHAVNVNDHSGIRQIVDHLIEVHGCSKIVFIKGMEGSKVSIDRFNAYIKSLEAHDIPVDPQLIFQGDFDFESGRKAVKALLEKKVQFDAVVAANDNMAIGAMDEFYLQLGRIPQDIPITGFDDIETSRLRALTTVNHSSSETGKTAAQILLRLIRGEEVPMEVEFPAKVVLRSSCGCLPRIVKNSLLEIESADNKGVKSKGHIWDMLKELNHTMGITLDNCSADELLDHEQKLMDAFFEEFEKGKKNRFLYAWSSMILCLVLQKVDLLPIHNILSAIRKVILEILPKDSDLIRAGNMFQAARTQISNAIQSAGASNGFFSADRVDKLIGLEEELIANTDWNAQIELIYKNIWGYGINKCYIALYSDPRKPMENSKLILACDSQNRYYTGPDGILYRTSKILPDNIMEQLYQERFNIIVQALHVGNDPLGFVIFGFESRINRAFDIIRYRLSVALKNSLLVKGIKNYADDLERQVFERTEELYMTNQQLTKEIMKRKDAEDKLKSILAELEVYNVQLHHATIRDELTGLYNRRGFMTIGREKYEHCKKIKKEFLIFFADLDGLKQINDTYGHKEGDCTIVKTAEVLNKSFRKTDIIARLGGDEFVAIAFGSSPVKADITRKRVEQYCEDYNRTSDKPYMLSISIGSSYFNPESPVGFEELLKMADDALYHEKQRRKGNSL